MLYMYIYTLVVPATCPCNFFLVSGCPAQVTRRLLGAGLRDPDNQRFLLLSETCVPLYSALIVYQQLMHEWRSRISACAVPGWDRSIERCNFWLSASFRHQGWCQRPGIFQAQLVGSGTLHADKVA